MSWCDKLASTPMIGFKFEPHVMSSEEILRAFGPILDRSFAGDAAKFSAEFPDAISFAFTTEDGFTYGVDSTRIHVQFRHRMKARPVSGGPPVMELLSRPQPFSELLPEATERLIEATLLLPGISKRQLRRVGVISVTQVDEHDVPPGIGNWIKYLGRPWGGEIDGMSFSINSTLRKSASETDRCVHILKRPENDDELLTLQFDWQREYALPRAVTEASLKAATAEAHKGALAYFEELAEGSRFDEKLIENKE